MDGRRAYILAVTALFILASLLVGYLSSNLGPNSDSLAGTSVEPVRIAIGLEAPGYYSFKVNARVEVEVKQGNETVYHEVRDNDPITLQWYRAIVTIIFQGYVWGITWLDTTGTARGMIDTEYGGINPVAYIQLGTDCTRATESDIKLGNPIYTVKPTLKYYHDTVLTTYRFVYTASVTPGVSLTLCEVGLLLQVDVDTSSTTSATYLLVARDNIGPVTVSAGSTVTVTYTIEMPYNTERGFNINFYHIIGNYLLGFIGTNGTRLPIYDRSGTLLVGIDLGYSGYTTVPADLLGIAPVICFGYCEFTDTGNVFTIVKFQDGLCCPAGKTRYLGTSGAVTYRDIRISTATIGGFYIMLSANPYWDLLITAYIYPGITPGVYLFNHYYARCLTSTPTGYFLTCLPLIFYAPDTTSLRSTVTLTYNSVGTIVIELLFRTG